MAFRVIGVIPMFVAGAVLCTAVLTLYCVVSPPSIPSLFRRSRDDSADDKCTLVDVV
jgi:hypothetical protein